MRTLKFNVEPNQPNYVSSRGGNNGLFNTLYRGYSHHIPITISPDDVLNTITCLWAKYITINAEKFRDEFVNHKDKKELIYISGGSYSEGRHQEFLSGLTDLVREDQSSENTQWFDIAFSTTTETDVLIRSCCLLASQKEYYDYGIRLLCGFPEINLTGDVHDWCMLALAISNMPTFDDGMAQWKSDLEDVLEMFCISDEKEPNEDWWQSAITGESYGSGPQTITAGWAKVFNPIDEAGHWLNPKIETKNILNLEVDFEVKVNDNGEEFTLEFRAGVTDVESVDGRTIQPNKFLEHKKK